MKEFVLLYLLHHLKNPDDYPINQPADINGDGESDTTDVLHLLRHSLDPERYPLDEQHVKEVIPGKAATCTEPGLTEGIRCSVCGKILKEQEAISPKHSFSQWFDIEVDECNVQAYQIRFLYTRHTYS